MKFKKILLVAFIIWPVAGFGQSNIQGKDLFSTFLKSEKESLLIIGDNHTSSIGPKIYPTLIRYLHKKNGLNTLLIEFGPSEAYFYKLYLQTGNEKWLNYTIFAGSYKDWRKAWRKIYHYNKSLDRPLNIIGIDFDRTRTFGYALYKIFSNYDNCPKPIDSLMTVISDTTFYNSYTIGYPTKKDKKFVSDTKKILKKNQPALKQLLRGDDFNVIDQILKNHAIGYGGNREQELANNTKRIIKKSKENKFLLYIGRSHAYLNPIYGDKKWLAKLLTDETHFNIFTGVILFQNSQLLGKDYKEAITLHEIKNKKPWKEYYSEIDKKAPAKINVVPLTGSLAPLAKYTNYVMIARNQGAIGIFR